MLGGSAKIRERHEKFPEADEIDGKQNSFQYLIKQSSAEEDTDFSAIFSSMNNSGHWLLPPSPASNHEVRSLSQGRPEP